MHSPVFVFVPYVTLGPPLRVSSKPRLRAGSNTIVLCWSGSLHLCSHRRCVLGSTPAHGNLSGSNQL